VLARRIAGAALLLAANALTVSAQSRWSLEGRVGAAVATAKFADVDVGTGVGFDGTVRFRVQPHLFVYAGWDWFHFTTDDELTDGEQDIEETGYAYGLRFQHPMNDRFDFWVRAGGTYDHIELENESGDIVADSKHGAGWEAGAGVAFRFRTNWQVTPGLRYRARSREMTVDNVTRTVKLTYVALSVGFVRTF
jgi:opacity protein-like surface antigen